MSNLEMVDQILEKLLSVKGLKPTQYIKLAENEITTLIGMSYDLFQSESSLLELQAPIQIVGDIHGQYYDLLRLFEIGGWPPDKSYVFLGDYVDRGKHSLETICLLLCFKIKYKDKIYLLRGNHECAEINKIYGFYDECKDNIQIFKLFAQLFNVLPIAAIIDDKIFCVHGGLSPDKQLIQSIRLFKKPQDVPDQGVLCDLLWSDPEEGLNGWAESERGVSFVFGANIIEEFLNDNQLDLIVRAHQVTIQIDC